MIQLTIRPLTSVQLGRTDDCDRAGCPAEDRIHQMTEENPTGDHADVATQNNQVYMLSAGKGGFRAVDWFLLKRRF